MYVVRSALISIITGSRGVEYNNRLCDMCHNDVVTKIDYSSDRHQRKEKVLLVCVNNSTKLFSVDILLYLLNFYGIHGLSGLKFLLLKNACGII